MSDATPRAGSQSSLMVSGAVLAARGFRIAGLLFDAEPLLRRRGNFVRAGSLRAMREHLSTVARALEVDDEDRLEKLRLRHEHASACDHAELLLRSIET